MAQNETIVRFDGVTFNFGMERQILDNASFSVRAGQRITLMGQNGAGKSTIFGMISGILKPEEGAIHVNQNFTIGMAKQVISPAEKELTVREYFAQGFTETIYDLDKRIADVLEVVNFHAPLDRKVKTFSGGQQGRFLLASALIQDPDLLLLDEPTNNLDKAGIKHLTEFLVNYYKTCIVISHDADFLNAFTDGVLYLDVHTHKVEQYVGDYFKVVEEITTRIEKENIKNARLAKEAQANKEQANVFAHKGGKLRAVAKKMREKAEEFEANRVEVRKEDKTIKKFTIPCQEDVSGVVMKIESFKVIRNYEPVIKKRQVWLRKNEHLLLTGPNGIGKSTLLEALASGTAEGAKIAKDIVVGYYRQDFSTLNFSHTVMESLTEVAGRRASEQDIRAVAAGFLITSDMIKTKINHLSEGQKGLVSFARLVLQKPGLLILDEPTNHINFRHLPVIAAALDAYKGAMILVSHVPEFVKQIRIDTILDLDGK